MIKIKDVRVVPNPAMTDQDINIEVDIWESGDYPFDYPFEFSIVKPKKIYPMFDYPHDFKRGDRNGD
ncbi:hypothetical protein [Anaerostipes faecalis]|uniref:hypothetical protein n=1 Tax=Anaerostipes faecalis TaxID=2738446 RepID=UPI003F0584A4